MRKTQLNMKNSYENNKIGLKFYCANKSCPTHKFNFCCEKSDFVSYQVIYYDCYKHRSMYYIATHSLFTLYYILSVNKTSESAVIIGFMTKVFI